MMRVLVRLPSWLGDFVLAEPVARALHETLDGALGGARLRRLAFAGPARFLELFDGRFDGAERIATDDGEPFRAWRDFDVALLLNGSARAAGAAARGGVPGRGAGPRGGRGPPLTRAIVPARSGVPPRRLPRPFDAACRELLALALGLGVRDVVPRLEHTAQGDERALARGAWTNAPFVLVGSGGRPNSAKAPPLEVLEAWLAALEGALPAEVVLAFACGPGEEERARRLAVGSRRIALVDPIAELPELVSLAARAVSYFGPDGGPRHVAAAAGASCVVAFGPTDPRHTASGLAARARLLEAVDCGPCHRERCPFDGEADRRCFRRIDAARVVRAVALDARS